MAEFKKGNALNAALDEIIEGAQKRLVLISPFIKFHSRVKEVLKQKQKEDLLFITVVFGKNETAMSKSLSQLDFEFLQEFPNIEIRFEPRLHAKYYANDETSLLSSMNLYDYSQNNNIEFGVVTATGFVDNLLNNATLDTEAWDYFSGVIEDSKLMFKSAPVYEEKFMGLTKKYVKSKVEHDDMSKIFRSDNGKKRQTTTQPKQNLVSATILGKPKAMSYKKVCELMTSLGYIDDTNITSLGKTKGLAYNSKDDAKWIVYPKELRELL